MILIIIIMIIVTIVNIIIVNIIIIINIEETRVTGRPEWLHGNQDFPWVWLQ